MNLEDIVSLEKKSNKRLFKTVSELVMSEDNVDDLASKLPKSSLQIQLDVRDIRNDAKDLADEYSEESHKITENRKLLVASSSMNVIRIIASSIAISVMDGSSYLSAAKSSLKNNKSIINRLSSTEMFNAYNEKIKANSKNVNGYYTWVATLDARTCEKCESMDGKIFNNESDIPDFHVRCRCFLSFSKKG